MKLLKIICGIATCCLCNTAHAYSLRIDDKSLVLNQNKYTSPALATSINGVTFYGALYSGVAPQKTLRVQHGDKEYWLGQNCDAGMYSETGVSACTDCTIGHYCPGGARHVPCTYGAMSCHSAGATTDMPAPIEAPVNKFMTLDEVNEFVPETDLSDWQKLSCCLTMLGATIDDTETLNNVRNACATGTIGPGTYLFVARYNSDILSDAIIDVVDGTEKQFTNAYIAVFDHPVSYATMHGRGIFQHFVDTEHETYTQWTISTTGIGGGGWIKNINETNIINLASLPKSNNYSNNYLCVYELK